MDKRRSNLPPLNDLHSFSKTLNSDREKSNEGINLQHNPEDLNEINVELNQPISQNEVLKAIKDLKNN